MIQHIGNTCKEENDDTRVFTFGIGNGCNQYLVQESAKAGKGKHYFVLEYEMDQLKSKIIDSLQFASEPSLTGCSFTFGVKEQTSLFNPSRVCSQGTMFRNQLSRYFTVIPESAFDSILC